MHVRSHATIAMGDVANVALHSHACEENGCPCGGADLHVIMSQADGAGLMLIMPMKSWAYVSSAVNKAVSESHPEYILSAYDNLADESNIRRPPPMPMPAVMPRVTDAIPFHNTPAVEVPTAPDIPISIADLRASLEAQWIGAWIFIGPTQTGKIHSIAGLIIPEIHLAAVEVKTHCGRKTERWGVATGDVETDDFCSVCLSMAQAPEDLTN